MSEPRHRQPTTFHLTDEDLERELDRDRRTERLLWARAVFALMIPAIIIVVKVVWFP